MKFADKRILIVADDLSGAADCGIACIGAGREVAVALDRLAPPNHNGVLCVDLDTRRLSLTAAAQRTHEFTQAHKAPEILIFKKIDSTLRGHVAAELAAMLMALRGNRKSIAIFAASYPAMGRTAFHGQYYLHRMPMENSEMWQHERRSGRADILDVLKNADLQVRMVSLEDIRNGQLPVIILAQASGYDVLACDAQTDDDLIAAAARQIHDIADFDMVWVGSAGLAHALGRTLPVYENARQSEDTPSTVLPFLFVIGSHSSISGRQTDILIREANHKSVDVPVAALSAGNLEETAYRLYRALDSGRDTVLRIKSDAAADLANGEILSHRLAELTAPHVKNIGGLVVTGGETARAVLGGMKITSLRLVREVEPGVPLAISHDQRRLPVITKAGGFGNDATFLNCYAALSHYAGARPKEAQI